MPSPIQPTPEWSRKVAIDRLGHRPLTTTLSATPEECRDLARRLRVEGIDNIEGQIVLSRESGNHIIAASGEIRATVRQACVVTLAPLSSKIASAIEAWYSDEAQAVNLNRARRARETQHVDVEVELLNEADDPEPVVGGMIDIAELATQFLSLAIDPFPRSAAARAAPAETPLPARPNPFAALKDWKAGQRKD